MLLIGAEAPGTGRCEGADFDRGSLSTNTRGVSRGVKSPTLKDSAMANARLRRASPSSSWRQRPQQGRKRGGRWAKVHTPNFLGHKLMIIAKLTTAFLRIAIQIYGSSKPGKARKKEQQRWQAGTVAELPPQASTSRRCDIAGARDCQIQADLHPAALEVLPVAAPQLLQRNEALLLPGALVGGDCAGPILTPRRQASTGPRGKRRSRQGCRRCPRAHVHHGHVCITAMHASRPCMHHGRGRSPVARPLHGFAQQACQGGAVEGCQGLLLHN